MRRFRSKRSSGYEIKPVEKGKIYNNDYFLDKGGILISENMGITEYWEEVLEETEKQLHQTDLGYYSGLAMQGVLASDSDIGAIDCLASKSIRIAKELIKQLKEEG